MDNWLDPTCRSLQSFLGVTSGLVVYESEVSNLFHSFNVKDVKAEDVFQVVLRDAKRKVSDVEDLYLITNR